MLKVTEEERRVFESASTLTLKAPKRFTVFRGASARQMKLLAHRAWRYFVRHFHEVRLDAKEGSYNDPNTDYGAIRARLQFVATTSEPPGSMGIKFMGTDSYDKAGRSKEHEALSHRKHRMLIRMAFESLASTKDMVLINPRCGFFRGCLATWHTDANPRGAHPNAVRPADTGFGILIYHGVDFRCSVIEFDGLLCIPLDINAVTFRYVWLDPGSKKTGRAAIGEASATSFWEKVVHAPDGPRVIGSTCCSIITMEDGFLQTCPLDYRDIRATKADLDRLSIEDAFSCSLANPIPSPHQLWSVAGMDPTCWDVFYGWKNIHCSFGNPLVARAHVTNCPYRQNGTGQNRRVAVERPPKPIDQKREAILALRDQQPAVVEIEDRHGALRRGLVVRVEDALDPQDMVAVMAYEDEDGCLCIERREHLGVLKWVRIV